VDRRTSHEVVEWHARQREEIHDLRVPLNWGALLLRKLP
jgi:hypothetical protein